MVVQICVKRRNGILMGLNGMHSTANTYNSNLAIANKNWNMNAMDSNDNSGVIMRSKKEYFRTQEEAKLLKDVQEKQQQRFIRYRPLSTANSYASSLASSGMTDIRWRDSHISPCSSLSTSCQLIHESPNMDGAVHEEKLNYLRAHIAELNRRITSLMESSDHPFPTHSNLQIKTQMPQPSDDHSQYYRRQNIKLCQELADKNLLIERLLYEKAEKNKKHSSAFQKVEPKRLTTTKNAERNHYLQSHSWKSSEGTLM
uniref:Uncharacterized protein n=1 Tax=Wuchereria bancrofti TaxID=6293 RepID=A0A1I8EVU3_WUCBA